MKSMRSIGFTYFKRHTWIEYLGATIVLIIATFLAHGQSLYGSWRWDDGAHLIYAINYSPLQYFFNPEITRLQSGANLTPWNALFYDINIALFGMNAAGHYSHLLIILALGVTLFYAVLRQWLPPLPSMLGATMVLLGKPTVHIAAGLMHGHYATGFALTMLSIWAWVQYFRERKTHQLVLSIFAYLLATTCKEIYVPLPLLLFFLPVTHVSERIRAILPFVLVGALYTGWRYLVLGRLIGGYSQGIFEKESLFNQLLGIPELLIDAKLYSFVFITLLTIHLFIFFSRKNINYYFVFISIIIAIIPLIPLTKFPGIYTADRYLFIPWITLSTYAAILLTNSKGSIYMVFGQGALLFSLLFIHQQEKQRISGDLNQWDALSRFSLSIDKSRQAIFLEPDDGYKRSMLTNTRYTADLLTPNSIPGNLHITYGSCMDLRDSQLLNMEIFELVNEKVTSMSDARRLEKIPIQHAKSMPLDSTISLAQGVLNWKFGPYHDGIYHVFINDDKNAYIVPKNGSVSWKFRKKFKLSFCSTRLDEGICSISCSPKLDLDLTSTEATIWKGYGQ